MTRYHSDEYIRFLRNIRPDNVGEYAKLMQRCMCSKLQYSLEYNNFDVLIHVYPWYDTCSMYSFQLSYTDMAFIQNTCLLIVTGIWHSQWLLNYFD